MLHLPGEFPQWRVNSPHELQTWVPSRVHRQMAKDEQLLPCMQEQIKLILLYSLFSLFKMSSEDNSRKYPKYMPTLVRYDEPIEISEEEIQQDMQE